MFPMMRDDFGTIDTPEAAEERAQQAPVGVGQALAATAGQTTGDIMRFAKHKLEPEPFFREGSIKSPEELNKQFNLKGENQFKNYMHEDTASEIVDALHKRQKADEVYARFSEQHNYLTRMATGFVGSMLDPVEVAAMFVPGLGEERLAYKLATMGYGRQAAAFMSKVGAGASAGMAGAAALEPLKAVMAEDELHDWSVRDAMTDVFMAAPAGALMHAGLVPAFHSAAAFAKIAKPEPYVRDYSFWDTDRTTPEEMALNVKRGAQRGVERAFDQEINKQPPSFGHVNELDRMNAIERHIFTSSTFAQIMTGREPTAGHILFPDHTEQARRLAPEAHAEWDKLQSELNSIVSGHVWGEPPSPEQLNDPAWKLEQELREHTRNILPVSWDLRVAEGLDHEKPRTEEPPMTELETLKKERQSVEDWHKANLEMEARGGKSAEWRKEHYTKKIAELDKRIKEIEEPTHVNAPEKPASLNDVTPEPKPAFKITDDRGTHHDVKAEQTTSIYGKKMVVFSIDNDVAQAKLKQRDDGRWEVAWMKVKEEHRGHGVMGKIYDAIEREYGNQMIPSGLLKEKGYNFWKQRNPEAVKYHRQLSEYGSNYHSPRFIKEQIEEFEAELLQARKDGDVETARELREELKPWRAAWNSIPEEGKTPEAINAMYSFGGVRAAVPPKGLRVAKRMEEARQRREDIWAETGWHRGPTGGWRFEIDDSKAIINTDVLGKRKSRMSGSTTLGSLFDHPDLYRQYPDLKDLTVKMVIDPNLITENGLHVPYGDKHGIYIYVNAKDVFKAKQTLLHEIQHAIQTREGERSPRYNTSATANQHPLYQSIVRDVKNAVGNDTSKDWNMWIRYAIYQHMEKEIESRLTENRMYLNEGSRTELAPFPGPSEFHYGIPPVVQEVVTKHLGTNIFDIKSYGEYLNSPEYKARQEMIDARGKRIREALDKLKEKAEPERAKARASADKEKARIEKAKADEEAAKQKAAESQKRADAMRSAEAEAVRTEAEAKRVQSELEKLMEEVRKENQKGEAARQAAATAEADLHKANERLKIAEAEYKAAEKEHASLQKELDEITSEIESARDLVEAQERERLDAARKREGETIVAQGMTDPAKRIGWISAMAVDPKLIAREESGHAIRYSGLFKPEEWGILRDAAINRGWIDDMPDNVRARYEEEYAGRGVDGVRDSMVEEAIMQRFARGPEAWGEAGGPVARFMSRIKELLERIGNWMTSRGFQSARDVFNAMESGKIASRETMEAHPARRMSEIQARMEELKPTILEAYNTAKANSQYDIPSIANMQRTRAKYGEAPAISQNELTKVLEQLYGPKEEQKFTPAKPGEIPIELQMDEQRLQTMIEEGYKPDPDEVTQHIETQRVLQEALSMEQGYQQAAECLIMAGMR